jgi:hypothetical protein
VTRRLKAYGIAKPDKSNGERRYNPELVLPKLRHIQRNYGIDLGILDAGQSNDSALTDPARNPQTRAS